MEGERKGFKEAGMDRYVVTLILFSDMLTFQLRLVERVSRYMAPGVSLRGRES